MTLYELITALYDARSQLGKDAKIVMPHGYRFLAVDSVVVKGNAVYMGVRPANKDDMPPHNSP